MSFLADLAARRRFGMRPGLETMRALCDALDEPQRRFKALHVAGTNGKGAVCAILDAALRATPGLRVGRYTSPHLVKLNERFFLDGAPVDDATLERIAKKVENSIPRLSPDATPTFFEALTAVAFQLYAEAKADYAVLECGLGGRLDATNVCDPALCVITKIGLDHCDWLGDTVEKIAAEKAGIVKPGVPVVLGRNEPSVRAVVEARAREVGAPFFFAPDLADESEIPADFSLVGSFNRENAVTALAALKVLADSQSHGTKHKAQSTKHKAQSTPIPSSIVWPGRYQKVGDFIVDGAHNPPAARALAEALRGELKHSNPQTPKRFALIAGFCGDKDVREVLSILAPFVSKGYAVRTNNPRSLTAEETAVQMRAVGIDAVACSSLREAISAQGTRPKAQGTRHKAQSTLICGSLFLAGEALVELGAYPWGPIRYDPSEKLKI